MNTLIRTILLCLIITHFTYALSPFEKAIIADENGDIDVAFELLFDALESPNGQEIEIRQLLQEYLILMEDPDLIEQNQKAIDKLFFLENINDLSDDEYDIINSNSNSSSWSQRISIANNLSTTPFDDGTHGLFINSYAPEFEYSLSYYFMSSGFNHSFDATVNYERTAFYKTYEWNDTTSAYEPEIEKIGTLEEYSLSNQLSYFIYKDNWYFNLSAEAFQSDYIDLSFGSYAIFGYSPYKSEFGNLNFSLFANRHQEFGQNYALNSKYTFSFLERSLKFSLGYGLGINLSDSYTGNSLTAIKLIETIGDSLIFSEDMNYGEYEVLQENQFQSFSLQIRYKPTSSLSLIGQAQYTLSKNLKNDTWYLTNTNYYHLKLEDEYIDSNQTIIYTEEDTYYQNTTDSISQEQSVLKQEDLLTSQKLRFKFGLSWEFHKDGYLNFNYTKLFLTRLGEDTNLVGHPYYNEQVLKSTYINLEYQLEF